MSEKQLQLGQIVMTAGIDEKVKASTEFARFVNKSMTRHRNGDWGELCAEDKKMNDHAFKHNDERILSAYEMDGEKIWIITEYDRSVTTILLPDEY